MTAQELRWHLYADSLRLAERAARAILAAAREAIAARGRFRIVLAGGTTPRAVYARLAAAATDWPAWEIWFGDERCLPAADAGRNNRMAADVWLDRVPIPPESVHAIPAEQGAAAAAAAYARALAPLPGFDLVLLGLGEDGHTAGLFPARDWNGAAVLAVGDAPKPPPERVSLSAATLSRGAQTLFLVSGDSKRDAVAAWRAGAAIPAAAIRPAGGVDVLLDLAAWPGT
ncbi:MAG TPA: 6-phosphogluconolactonase [Acidiferrobacterales bacterium]